MTPAPLPARFAEFARRAAQSAAPVLLLGETGSGKTYLARLLHDSGPRAAGPFKRTNCGAVPDSLFEREMFGHERGAYTDAKEAQPGLFEAADGGTLFLDEVGEMPLSVKPKLLAALEERQIRRIGATQETEVDVRIIAATNQNLKAMIAAKRFRERLDELPRLADHLLRQLARKKMTPPGVPPELDESAVDVLRSHAWPGKPAGARAGAGVRCHLLSRTRDSAGARGTRGRRVRRGGGGAG
jgi:transcriptional regulator with PAS, ATPase and Fis domain